MRPIRLLEPWRTRLLWTSLCLNVFGMALLAVPLFMHPPHRGPAGPPSFDGFVARMARDLPPEDADVLRAEMGRERPWYEMGRERLDEQRDMLARAVAHDPFDPAATHAALQELQDRMRESATRFDDSLVMAMAKLSPMGRTRLAETLRRRRP
jgi:uncharacterized membrane protein